MFQPGDRIEIDKPHGKKITAMILTVDYRNATYIARVRREDTGEEDVFAWNIYQDEISVRMAAPEPMVTMTQRELANRIAGATATGYSVGYTTGYEACDAEWHEREKGDL